MKATVNKNGKAENRRSEKTRNNRSNSIYGVWKTIKKAEVVEVRRFGTVKKAEV